MRPTIGITVDNQLSALPRLRYLLSATYAQAVESAGGVPVMLAQLPDRIEDYLTLCDGFVLTGGDDPRTEAFGCPTDPRVTPITTERQAFETALLEQLAGQPDKPVLGVCLGMQMMGLVAGGRLDQFMPETLGQEAAALHWNDHRHAVRPTVDLADSVVFQGGVNAASLATAEPSAEVQTWSVVSHHRQAIRDAGRLRVVARAEDGVIEAIDDPARPFYAGVQWHPERGGSGPLHLGLFQRLVEAAHGD